MMNLPGRTFLALATLFLFPLVLQATDCPKQNQSFLSQLSSQPPVQIVSDPIVGTNDDGHLELFVIGMDGAVWHSWQQAGAPAGSPWSPWASFGNPSAGPLGETSAVSLAVAKDPNGRLHLFAIDKGSMWEVVQAAKNVNWGSWHPLGSPQSHARVTGVWAAQNEDQRIELFVQQDGQLFHTWQLGAPNFSWQTGFTAFSNPPNQTLSGSIAVAADSLKRIVVVAAFSGSAFVLREGQINTGWRDWESLGKPGAVSNLATIVGLANNADGRLELLATAQDGGFVFWHSW
jgi:hypothetical protein